jgi:hypothetical protein
MDLPKQHIIGIRMSPQEVARIREQVEKEHLSYMSTLVRKAIFFYMDYMDKQEDPIYE